MNIPNHANFIHQKALRVCREYKRCEADLLEAIIQVREQKIYKYFSCTSVYEYCVKVLGLDAGVVYGFTAVANKIKEVPELQNQIRRGELNVSTAKRITSVINAENKNEWFAKAQTLSVRQLEKEVIRVNPKAEVPERASYLDSKRVKLQLGLDEKLVLKLRRIQDLESQKQRKPVSLEDALAAMADIYLEKKDPVEKAKRAVIRKSNPGENFNATPNENSLNATKNPSTWKDKHGLEKSSNHLRLNKASGGHRRTAIPAYIKHKVNLRDGGRCQHEQNSSKCGASRFIEIHHKQPVALGGGHSPENLITLCSAHHKMEHESEPRPSSES